MDDGSVVKYWQHGGAFHNNTAWTLIQQVSNHVCCYVVLSWKIQIQLSREIDILQCDGYGRGPDVYRKSMLDVQTYYPFLSLDRYVDSFIHRSARISNS